MEKLSSRSKAEMSWDSTWPQKRDEQTLATCKQEDQTGFPCLPIKDLGYHLNKEQFLGAIRIRYCWILHVYQPTARVEWSTRSPTCFFLTKVRGHWFPESCRPILTIVLIKTIFTMWRRNLELDLQCFSYLSIEFAFFDFQSFFLYFSNRITTRLVMARDSS